MLKELIIKKEKSKDERKYTTISIRVSQNTKDKWTAFCKDNKISQQATFEAILSSILEGKD